MPFRDKFAELKPEEIAREMVKLSKSMDDWMKPGRKQDTLWCKLAHVFAGFPGPEKAKRLQNWFHRNRLGLKVAFAEAANVDIGQLPPPVATSTPKRVERICICNVPKSGSDSSVIFCDNCERWYHGICIRTDVNKMSKFPQFVCPQCRGNTRIKYPSIWLESIELPIDDVSPISRKSDEAHCEITAPLNESLESRQYDQTQSHIVVSEYPSAELQKQGTFRSLASRRPRGLLPDSPENRDEHSPNIDHVVVSDEEEIIHMNYMESLGDNYWSDENVEHRTGPEVEHLNSNGNDMDLRSKYPRKREKSSSPVKDKHNAKDKDDADFLCDEVANYMMEKGIPVPPTEFTAIVEKSEWSKYEETDEKTGTKTLKKTWPDMFREQLETHNPLCRFVFRHTHFNKAKKEGSVFWYCCGNCKHGHEKNDEHEKPCWKIRIQGIKPAETSSQIKFRVQCRGDFQHRYGARVRNHIKGSNRKALRQKLKLQTAAVVATELNQHADLDAIRCGNANSLYKTKHLAQIRHEEISCEDLDQDAICDLWKRMQRKPAINDYVKVACGKPVCIMYYCDFQLEIVKKLRQSSNGLVGHFDGTGNVTRKRDLPETTGRVFLYAIVVTNPKDKEPPIAVCEFLLSEHTTLSISSALGFFLRKCTEYCNLPSGEPVFTRIECDDSAAMYSAIIQETTKCWTTKEYLDMCWRELFLGESPCRTNCHLCRSHAMNMLTKHLKNAKYGLVYGKQGRLTSLFRMYLNSTSMNEVVFYVRRIMVLLLSEFYSEEVADIMSLYREVMPSDFSAERDWRSFLQEAEPKAPIYKSCAFGRLFINMKEEVKATIQKDHVRTRRNPLYSPMYCMYLLRRVFPYTPLFTHLMMKVRGDTEMCDTNNPVEEWHNLVKRVHNFKKWKLSRYIKDNLPMITGRCIDFIASFESYDATKRDNARCASRKRLNPQTILTSTPKVKKTTKPRRILDDPRKYVTPKKSLPTLPSKVSTTGSTSGKRTYLQEMQWCRRGEAVAKRTRDIEHFDNIPFIKWGYDAPDECPIEFSNSCPLDNCMTVMLYCYLKFADFRYFIDHPVNVKGEQIRHVIRLLNEEDGPKANQARLYWYRSVLNEKPTKTTVDLVGDEHNMFIEKLQDLTPSYQVQHTCRQHEALPPEPFTVMGVCQGSVHVGVREINAGGHQKRCPRPRCKRYMERVIMERQNAPLPVLAFGVVQHMGIEDIPKEIDVLGSHYRLIACTVYYKLDPKQKVGHYITAFFYNRSTYQYDGLNENEKIFRGDVKFKYMNVSSAWYKLV